MFARPEYNSTLRMKLEADRLRESEIDVAAALKKTLTLSDDKQTHINEKVCTVNWCILLLENHHYSNYVFHLLK